MVDLELNRRLGRAAADEGFVAYGSAILEAADEIERLRSALGRIRYSDSFRSVEHCRDIAIEALDFKPIESIGCTTEDIETWEQPEQKRPDGCEHAWHWVDGERRCKGCDAATGEIERLRTAMEDIRVELCGHDQRHTDRIDGIAREALNFNARGVGHKP